MTPRISFRQAQEAWDGFYPLVKKVIVEHGLRRVLDVGGGANPLLTDKDIEDLGLDYTILDVSAAELDKASSNLVQKKIGDVAATKPPLSGPFDLAVSKMLMEHVKDVRRMHVNIFEMLSPGGMAIHFFPTLYALPFVVNNLVPEEFSDKLLDVIAPRDRHVYAKFQTHYVWCRGPAKASVRKYEEIGYEVVEYRGYFGHSYYQRIPPIDWLHRRVSALLLHMPIAALTSYSVVLLRKPG